MKLRPGANIRVCRGDLEGAIGTVIDDGGGIPELPDLIRVSLPDLATQKWWIDPANLEVVR